jgi:heterodisulfide reductase subunit B
MKLLEDEKLRKSVNATLKRIGKEFKGISKVKHFVNILIEKVRVERIKRAVVKPLKSLKVASHVGCHLIRPSTFIRRFENEESIIRITGAEYVKYIGKESCCGFPAIGVDEKLALGLLKERLEWIRRTGANVIVTFCPSCHLQFDLNQLALKGSKIPVLHYTQLLGLAQGFDVDELGLYENRVPVDEVLKLIE